MLIGHQHGDYNLYMLHKADGPHDTGRGIVNRLYAIVSNSLHACAILKGDCIEFATAARAYSLSALST